jgi:hypothetical protein
LVWKNKGLRNLMRIPVNAASDHDRKIATLNDAKAASHFGPNPPLGRLAARYWDPRYHLAP